MMTKGSEPAEAYHNFISSLIKSVATETAQVVVGEVAKETAAEAVKAAMSLQQEWPDPVMSVEDVMKKFGVGKDTVHAVFKRKGSPAFRAAGKTGKWLVRYSELVDFLKSEAIDFKAKAYR